MALRLHLGTSKAWKIQHTIIVDQSGRGNFTKVQQAIDSIPPGSRQWICIKLRPGTYNEKVKIPREKPYILLEGESSKSTIIQYGDHGSSIESSTFTLEADNFAARHITFKNVHLPSKNFMVLIFLQNTYNALSWAPAAVIQGDKASFLDCGFIGLQDTLTDAVGRHYFRSCYMEGAVDFIWGGGQSVFEGCTIHVNGAPLGSLPGFITAQARENGEDPSAFVFKYCNVNGSGQAYLGRAISPYSRVLFYKSTFSQVVAPEGWDPWQYAHQWYGELGCTGQGADKSKRVKWLPPFSRKDVLFLTNATDFINKENWIGEQLTLL
ncbi:Pectinesterase, catalytic [Dillenia turbinata]|uniref:pectinesterase n=1 Tax=Dillenia turbinata TaxID=194707 RepID=A0AAN8YY16_9MAGN